MLRNLMSAGFNKHLATPFLVASSISAQQLRVSLMQLFVNLITAHFSILDNFCVKKTKSCSIVQEKSKTNETSRTSFQLRSHRGSEHQKTTEHRSHPHILC